MAYNYYIVYPRGDRSKLAVTLKPWWEIAAEFALAYDDNFYARSDAVNMAKNLAERHGKTFVDHEEENIVHDLLE